MMAASLSRLASSAPEYPTVNWAVRLSRACSENSESPSEGISFPRACTSRILSLLASLGRPKRTILSNLPARSSAGSSVDLKLVAPMTSTCSSFVWNPSISTSSCMSPCSRSELSAPKWDSPPRARPMVSISSINMMAGVLARALAKRSLTRAAATPTYISTNSEPLAEKKGTPPSDATAFASSVLPVPGGPSSSTPLGSVAPMPAYRGSPSMMSMISWNMVTAWSTPATSSNRTPRVFSSSSSPSLYSTARLAPKLSASLRRLLFLASRPLRNH
mmetsp:Transcript_31243/g.43300  ORF Transcript_31243/g.43300 Transcript_31243/m.43300 type:complete len:275 (+) Transcript_31243:887-1711(+)